MIRTKPVEGVDMDGVLTLDLIREEGEPVDATLERILADHHGTVRMVLNFESIKEMHPGELRMLIANIISCTIVQPPVLVSGMSEEMQTKMRQLISGYCKYFGSTKEARAWLQNTEV